MARPEAACVLPLALKMKKGLFLGEPPFELLVAIYGLVYVRHLLWQPGLRELVGVNKFLAPRLCVPGLSAGLPFSKGVIFRSNHLLQMTLAPWAKTFN